MGSAEEPVYGVFRYSVPDFSLPAEERSLFAMPANKEVKEVSQELHDFRTSKDVVKGPKGLDVQGFTFLEHDSALQGDDWFNQEKLQTIYIQECIDLILKTTGAKRAILDGMTLREKAANEQDLDPSWVKKRGDDREKLYSMSRDKLRVPNRESAAKTDPSRALHVDYSVNGLRSTIRWSRPDIAEMAKSTIEAEDAGKNPRYGVYGIWRPLSTVKRDPLAMLDTRSVDPTEVVAFESRIPSGVKEDAEHMRELLLATPPKRPEAHRWYWMPGQEPHEVVVIKFADTTSGNTAGCVHGSPRLPGTDDEPIRASINCRILVFWG